MSVQMLAIIVLHPISYRFGLIASVVWQHYSQESMGFLFYRSNIV